ncbi:MAG: oligosaccharide flippase family protein [Phycisphaerae bacterium]|jgi:O-antigen/teichoic acid export membrane protein
MEKRVAKNFIIYSLPDILAKCIFFLTMPITTLYLTTEDFGYITLFTLCSVPFTILVEFGAGYIINSTWFKFSRKQQRELLFNLLAISALMNFLAVIIVTAFYNRIFPILVGGNWEAIKSLYWVLILKVLFGIPTGVFMSWVIIEQKAKLSSIIQIINIILTAGVTILAVILTGSYKYVILGNVAVFIVVSLIQIMVMFSSIEFRFRYEYFKLAYEVGGPIFLRSIFNQIRKQVDTFYVAKLFGAGQLALYDFPKRFDSMFAGITANYDKSYEPFIYKQLSERGLLISNLRRVLFFWFYVTFLLSSVLFVFGRQLIILFTHGVFGNSYPLLLLILCVVFVRATFAGTPLVLVYYQKTKYIFFATLIHGILSIFLCVILVKLYGAKGGVVAIWAGTFVYFFINFLLKRKLCPEPFIEKITWPYVLIFHLLVVLKVFFNTDIPMTVFFVLIVILTIHGYLREKKYLRGVFNKGIKIFWTIKTS